MSVITIDMLRDVQKKMLSPPPQPTELKVGGFLRFKKHVEETLGQHLLQAPKPFGSFAGIPITVSVAVPEHIVVMMQGHEVVGIINLNKEPNG